MSIEVGCDAYLEDVLDSLPQDLLLSMLFYGV